MDQPTDITGEETSDLSRLLAYQFRNICKVTIEKYKSHSRHV